MYRGREVCGRDQFQTPVPSRVGEGAPCRQSRRSASIGCTLAARRAGIQLAPMATIINRTPAPHSVAGSDGAIPKSIDFTSRVTRNEALMPSAIAVADNDEASRTTMLRICRGIAPSAIRMPISYIHQWQCMIGGVHDSA
jgi:hypothetical protein